MSRLSKSSIALCGFMASGKTTVGALLADITGFEFVDADEVIERRAGRAISDIFSEDGEASFRELEREVIEDESRRSRLVLAVGGGAVLDPRNVSALKRKCVIYHLEVTPEEVLLRAGDSGGRPLLGEEEEAIRLLMQEREQAYRGAADVAVDTVGRSPGDVARLVAEDFERRKKNG